MSGGWKKREEDSPEETVLHNFRFPTKKREDEGNLPPFLLRLRRRRRPERKLSRFFSFSVYLGNGGLSKKSPPPDLDLHLTMVGIFFAQ